MKSEKIVFTFLDVQQWTLLKTSKRGIGWSLDSTAMTVWMSHSTRCNATVIHEYIYRGMQDFLYKLFLLIENVKIHLFYWEKKIEKMLRFSAIRDKNFFQILDLFLHMFYYGVYVLEIWYANKIFQNNHWFDRKIYSFRKRDNERKQDKWGEFSISIS